MIIDWTSLSISVGGELLGEWLEIQDVVRFDTACAGHDSRTAFLQYCCATTYSCEITVMSSSQMNWIAQRGFRLVDINFFQLDWSDSREWRPTLDALKKLLSANGTKIKRIKMGCMESAVPAPEVLAIIARYCQNLLHIEVYFDVGDPAAAVLFSSLRRIESIAFSDSDITHTSFRFLENNCTELRELYLCRLPLKDDALLAISRSCSNLRVLDISTCGTIGHKGVIAMLRSCPLLEEVHLSEMSAAVAAAAAKVLAAEEHCALPLKALTIDKLSTTELRAIVAKFSLLSQLRVTDCAGWVDWSCCLRGFTALSLCRLPSLTLTEARQLVSSNPQLTDLSLTVKARVSAAAVLCLLDGLPALQTLSVRTADSSRQEAGTAQVLEVMVRRLYPSLHRVTICLL